MEDKNTDSELREALERAFMRFNRGHDDIDEENLPSAYEAAAIRAIMAELSRHTKDKIT